MTLPVTAAGGRIARQRVVENGVEKHRTTIASPGGSFSCTYDIDTRTFQVSVTFPGGVEVDAFRAMDRGDWRVSVVRWVLPYLRLARASEGAGATMNAVPRTDKSGADVTITPAGYPGNVVYAVVPANVDVQQAFPVMLRNSAGVVLHLGTFGIYDTKSAATIATLLAEAGSAGFTPGPGKGATTFTWCGLVFNDVVVDPQHPGAHVLAQGTKPSFAILLRDAAAAADVVFDVELGFFQGRRAWPAHVVERSTGRMVAGHASLATAVMQVQNQLQAVATGISFMRAAVASVGGSVDIVAGSIDRGTVDHSPLQQGGSATAITMFTARIHNLASGQHVDVPLAVIHSQATGHADKVCVHAPFTFSPATSMRTISYLVVNPASLARTIDGVLERFTVTGIKLDQMRRRTGWIVLDAVAHPVLGGSVNIVLVPTGEKHPTFTGAIAIRNVNIPYDTLGLGSIFVAGSMRGGGGDLSWPNEAGTNPVVFKDHRAVWSDGVHGLAHVQDVLYTLAARAHEIVQFPYQDTWGTPGWRLLDATSCYFSTVPRAPAGSVLLRLRFRYLQDGPCVTIHAIVKPDGSMMVNWQYKLSNTIGPALWDRTDPINPILTLPRWWDPAAIQDDDGSRRYDPDDPSGMFLAFLYDVPFDTVNHP